MTTSLSTSPYGANRAQRRAALAQNKQRLTKRGGRQRQQWLNRPGGCRERIIADRLSDYQMHGYALISRHDSVTGKIERFATESLDATA